MTTPVPELLAAVGPRVRTSPFFDATVRAGLTSVSTYNHMWLPMGYGDPAAEYERLTTGVSMWDVAAQRHVQVTGPDAHTLVQRVTAIDIDRAEAGHAIYAPMVDHDGILINDPVLFHWHDDTWRFSIADADIRLWLTAIAGTHELRVSANELDTATLAIQGPKSPDVLEALGIGWYAELDQFETRPTTLRLADGTDAEVVISRSGWSHQGGVEIFLDDPADAIALWDTVAEAGAPFDIGPGAPNATERIESGLLSFGTDTGYHADPLELGLTDDLDLDGPDFIGRDALCRIRDDGPARRLHGTVIDGDHMDVLSRPAPLTINSDAAGQLRAATWSPRFDRNIGLALVDHTHEPGSAGTVRLPDGERTVQLVELPFDESLDD